MSKLDAFIGCVIIIMCVGLMGAAVNIDTPAVSGGDILGYVGALMSFQLENMPVFLSLVFDLISIIAIYLAYALIRGV
ncbi:MAG: hypothetical protein PHE50_00580 [Dehalococcoidales bacterium]|nr:hypothetical protein [Dehalococcoidales bacterium]